MELSLDCLLHTHKLLGTLLQIGGHIELTETPWQAICHEIPEETGYELSQLRLLQPKLRLGQLTDATLHPQPVAHITHGFSELDHNHTDISYAFTTMADPHKAPDKGESSDFHWVTASELETMGPDKILDNVRVISLHVLTTVLSTWEPVELSEYAR